ncbi:ragulator complex protein LAMTOR3 isoform X2 [Amia ocellicauda]|uniref:ragulator complex protein LAMTOR3 isoform X2 n=1 Tax=Amia ocellicauda TaxID=2972642 RepID=UPI003464703B
MADDLKRFLYKQLPSVEGLHAIVVTDRDGVPVIKGLTEVVLFPHSCERQCSRVRAPTRIPVHLGAGNGSRQQAGALQKQEHHLLLQHISDCAVQSLAFGNQLHRKQQCQHRFDHQS